MRANRLQVTLVVAVAASVTMMATVAMAAASAIQIVSAETYLADLKGMPFKAAEAVLAAKGFQPEIIPDVDNRWNPLRYYERERADDSKTLRCLRNVDVVEIQVNPDTQVVLGYSSRIQRAACVVR